MTDNGAVGDHEPDVMSVLEEQARNVQEQRAHLEQTVRAKMAEVDRNYNTTFEARMEDMGRRYSDHQLHRISGRENDVLRVNRVMREVARGLGNDWEFVFRCLMAVLPKEDLNAEVSKIEKYKPIMRPFQALTLWKDFKGPAFDINQLVVSLKDCAKFELADRTQQILTMDKESLRRLPPIVMSRGEDGETNGDGAEEDTGYNPIPDRKLLQLAKQLTQTYGDVAQHLGVDEEELEEVQQREGDTYQGAFKMLHLWKWEAKKELKDTSDYLVTALKKAGQDNLVSIIED